MNRILFTAAILLSSSSLLLIDAAIKGGAILLISACAAMLLRRDSASTRHLVWLVAVIAILVVPLFSALLPQWRVLPEWAVISIERAEQVSVETNLTDVTNPPVMDDWDGPTSSPVASHSNLFPAAEVTEPAFVGSGPPISAAKMAEATISVLASNVPTGTDTESTVPSWTWATTLTVV